MLVDEVREQIAPLKEKTERWIELMRTAHRLGIRSSATMVYGWGESYEQRLEHMLLRPGAAGRDRRLHRVDQLELPAGRHGAGRQEGQRLGLPEEHRRLPPDAGQRAHNLQASWVTQGPEAGPDQPALRA